MNLNARFRNLQLHKFVRKTFVEKKSSDADRTGFEDFFCRKSFVGSKAFYRING